MRAPSPDPTTALGYIYVKPDRGTGYGTPLLETEAALEIKNLIADLKPGDLVQADTADIRFLPGAVYKHFTAGDVVSRWDVLEVYHRATGQAAAGFLDALLERMPFPVRAIQVDGGSEFRAQFEEACQERGIQLFVLPPRSPKPACRQAGSTAMWSGPRAPTGRGSTR